MSKKKGSPQPFGVDIKGKNINFAVQVAKGKTCELLLYKRGKEVPEYQFDMPEEEGVGEVRFLSVEGLKADQYEYNFLIDGKVCVDPYVKELAGNGLCGIAVISAIYAQKDIRKAAENLKEATRKMVEA